MANNFKHVEHFADRNAMGVAYIKDMLAKVSAQKVEEDANGSVAMAVIRDIARKAFGRIPFGRVEIRNNAIETFQVWYNDFVDANNLSTRIHVTGVWSEETQAAFDSIVNKYAA